MTTDGDDTKTDCINVRTFAHSKCKMFLVNGETTAWEVADLYFASGRNNRSLVLAALMCSGSKVLCHASEELFLGGSSHYINTWHSMRGLSRKSTLPLLLKWELLMLKQRHVFASISRISRKSVTEAIWSQHMAEKCANAVDVLHHGTNSVLPNWTGMMALARLTWISCAAVFQHGRIFYGNVRMLYLCCCILLFELILNDQQVMLAQWICQQPDSFVLAQPLVWTWQRSAEVITINPTAKRLSVRQKHLPCKIMQYSVPWPLASMLANDLLSRGAWSGHWMGRSEGGENDYLTTQQVVDKIFTDKVVGCSHGLITEA